MAREHFYWRYVTNMQKILLIIIFIIGLLLRFYELGSVPNSLNWDEVSWGYNAYSIVQTGKDEHAVAFPLSFKAFGDFKQPMYVYLQTPGIALFGLSAFAVRFPSAFLGTLTILSVYILTLELFRKQKHASTVALLASAFFALSPWSIQFSRVAFEANVALFFIATGVALYLRGIHVKKNWLAILGIVVLSLSGYSYHSAKVFTPLLFGGLLFYSYIIHKAKWKLLGIFLIAFTIANSIWLIDARTTERGRSVLFTSQQTQILKNSVEKIEEDRERKDVVGEILHNRRFVYAEKYIQNYLKHFDLNYLFVLGDNPRHHPPGMGILYIVFLPFIIIGILAIIHRKIYSAWFLFYWLLLAPVASALAVDAPNASRSLVFLPTWDIFAAFGVVTAYLYIQDNRYKKVFIILTIILLILNIFYYLHNYFVHTNREFGPYWQYGYKEAIEYTKQFPGKRIVFLPDVEQGYIFYLFYNQYDPRKYLADGGSIRLDEKCFQIDNALFGNCQLHAGDIVVTTKELPELSGKKELQKIPYSDNTVAVRIVEY